MERTGSRGSANCVQNTTALVTAPGLRATSGVQLAFCPDPGTAAMTCVRAEQSTGECGGPAILKAVFCPRLQLCTPFTTSRKGIGHARCSSLRDGSGLNFAPNAPSAAGAETIGESPRGGWTQCHTCCCARLKTQASRRRQPSWRHPRYQPEMTALRQEPDCHRPERLLEYPVFRWRVPGHPIAEPGQTIGS